MTFFLVTKTEKSKQNEKDSNKWNTKSVMLLKRFVIGGHCFRSFVAESAGCLSQVTEGAKLIKFNILFPEYSRGEIARISGHVTPDNPLDFRLNRTFQAHVWQRTYTAHGRTLLALAFNYDVLSLKMLQFGVEQMNVNVVDAPAG